MLRNLRITVAVSSLVACMLLATMWVQSYLKPGYVNTPRVAIGSQYGSMGFAIYRANYGVWRAGQSSSLSATWFPSWKFEIYSNWYFFAMRVPHLFLLGLASAFAVTSLIKWHFSLRTLLIAMTVIAAWLGLIVSTI